MDIPGGAFEKIIDWIVAGAVGLGVWLYKGLHGRIAELEKTALREDAFSRYVEQAETSRTELRQSIIKLYDRLDELKSILLERK